MDEKRAVDAVCLYCGNAFATVSHIIPIDKPMKCNLDKGEVRGINNTKRGGVGDTQNGCAAD